MRLVGNLFCHLQLFRLIIIAVLLRNFDESILIKIFHKKNVVIEIIVYHSLDSHRTSVETTICLENQG